MKFIQIISDVKRILERLKPSGESRFNNDYILSRINAYRAKEIHDSWSRNGVIWPVTVQQFGACTFTPTTASDDPTVPKSGIVVGRCNIPAVVEIGTEDRGVYSVTTLDRRISYWPVPFSRLESFLTDSVKKHFCYFWRIGNVLYTYPYRDELNLMLILENPQEGYVINTSFIGNDELIYKTEWRDAEQYIVVKGGIIHNGVQYNENDVFTAVTNTYSGNGKVKLLNRKRRITMEDDYPMGYDMLEAVMMKILVKDFEIEKKQAADLIKDNRDERVSIQHSNIG